MSPEQRYKIIDDLRLTQKIINLLDNTQNQPSNFRTRNWVGINDESRGTHNKDNQIKFKFSMISSSLCD